MRNLLTSASKIVFILMAVASVVGFFMRILSEANFMMLVGAAFTFYFSNKGDGGSGSAAVGEAGAMPYLGK